MGGIFEVGYEQFWKWTGTGMVTPGQLGRLGQVG